MGGSSSKSREPPAPRPLGDIQLPQKSCFVGPSNLVPRPFHHHIETVKYPKTSIATFENRLQPLPEPSKPKERADTAWKIWEREVLSLRVIKADLDYYDNRIKNNADEAWKASEDRLLQIQFRREQAETELLTKKELPKPSLSLPSCIDLTARLQNFRLLDRKFFPGKSERPELTPEMQMLIDKASIPSPTTEVLVNIDGVDITRKDVRTLTGLNWLNDEVINAYMYLIVDRSRQPGRKRVYAFNTFFYPKVKESGYHTVKRWTRKVDIFSYDYLLVPVHLGNHWCLAFINFNKRTIEYYDSLGGGSHGCCDTLLEYLRSESNDKKKQDFDDENWRLINAFAQIGIPRQDNSSDCGVFACTYAEYLTRGAKLSFTQEHMRYFRRKMIYELLTRTILE